VEIFEVCVGSAAFTLFWINETKETNFKTYATYAAVAALLIFIVRALYGMNIWLTGLFSIVVFVVIVAACHFYQRYFR
jgi:hypothetical protein|tara:strand:- start:366 stop:599 length:234 start_codon:yes stop_codon:yes gene_type:complete